LLLFEHRRRRVPGRCGNYCGNGHTTEASGDQVVERYGELIDQYPQWRTP